MWVELKGEVVDEESSLSILEWEHTDIKEILQTKALLFTYVIYLFDAILFLFVGTDTIYIHMYILHSIGHYL